MRKEADKKVYRKVVDRIQQQILSGELKPGDKLSTERDMAEHLGVGRNSVREAMRALEIIGITESRQGGGNYIRSSTGGLFEPLSMMVKMNNCSFADVIEFRRMLETETAVLAAKRITPERSSRLRNVLKEMSGQLSEKRRTELDKQFHFMLAEFSDNFLFTTFYHAISRIFETFIQDARQVVLLRNEENQEKLFQLHCAVCEAVAQGDPDAAASAVANHFDFVMECL